MDSLLPHSVDEELIHRLALPLAQLYRRAHNAKTPFEQHQTAYYLWEALLKLWASTAIVEFGALEVHDAEVSERLRNLARPSIGHWWEFARLLNGVLAERGESHFLAQRDFIFGGPRDDLPRVVGLNVALRKALGETPGSQATVRLSEHFDRLVRYRNEVFGHGAVGLRSSAFYTEMAPAFMAGLTELLSRFDPLAGRRLLYGDDVRRQSNGRWSVELFELAGEAPRKLEPLDLPADHSADLPNPERIVLSDRQPGLPADVGIMRSLHPLVLFDLDASHIFFLNARRGERQAQYLCYTTGELVKKPTLLDDQCAFLATVLGIPVDPAEIEVWAARSRAEAATGTEDETPAADNPRRTLGEFQLLSKIGQGGMGVVYRAWQPSLARQVALKTLWRTGDKKIDARFSREIRALGRVDHPNLVKAFASGSDGDRWFYAMELIEGADLATVCERLAGKSATTNETDWQSAVATACEARRAAEENFSSDHVQWANGAASFATVDPKLISNPRGPFDRVVDLVRQVAQAAHALHEAGVLHRDIKPANVMVTPDGGRAVLTDLGLAQLADDTEGRLTRTRQFVGTLRYASPEQILAVGDLDRRADIYSLGATLWELLALRPLFDATDATPAPELMLRIQTVDPASLRKYNPTIPKDLEAIVQKCLEKNRDRRYATALELADELDRVLNDQPVRARRVGPAERAWRWTRRNLALASLLAAGVLLALLTVGIMLLRGEISRRERSRLLQAEIEAIDSEGGAWTADRLHNCFLKIELLKTLDPPSAARLRTQSVRRIVDELEHASRAPINSADEYSRIQALFESIRETLPPDQAAQLAAALPRREPLIRDPLRSILSGVALGTHYPVERNAAVGAPPTCVLPLDRGLFRPPLSPPENDVELQVEFDDRWGAASQLAIHFGDSKELALSFVLASVPLAEQLPDRPGPAMRDQNSPLQPLSLELRLTKGSDAIVMAQQRITLGRGPLRMTASKHDALIRFNINGEAELTFRMMYPFAIANAPYFAIDWPAGVGLSDLQVFGFRRSTVETPLLAADRLGAQSRFREAAQQYDVLSSDSRLRPDLRREASLKRIYCLEQTQATSAEARALCRRLLDDRAPNASEWWRPAAAAHLALAIFRNTEGEPTDKRRREFKVLLQEFDFKQLEAVSPVSDRRELYDGLRAAWDFDDSYFMLEHIPDRIKRLNDLIEVLPFVTDDPRERLLLQWRMIDAMHLEAQFDPQQASLAVASSEAERVVEQAISLLKRGLVRQDEAVAIVRDSAWLQVRQNQQSAAIARLQGLIDGAFRGLSPGRPLLEVELGRLEGSRGGWKEARRHLDRFFESYDRHEWDPSQIAYCDFAEACLLRGMAGRRTGESDAEVQRWWKRGQWRHSKPFAPLVRLFGQHSLGKEMRDKDRSLAIAACLGSLTQEIDDQEAAALVELLLVRDLETGALFKLIRRNVSRWFPDDYVRRTVLGLYPTEAKRQIIFDRVLGRDTFFEYFAKPTAHMVRTGVLVELRRGDLDGELEQQVFEVILKLTENFVRGRGGLSRDFLADVLAAWHGLMEGSGVKGVGNLRPPDGWRGARTVLERLQQDRLIGDDVPALFAYVIGCRTLARALNAKPGESEEWTVENARELLQYAVENTHPQTKLRRLAAARLEEAGAKGAGTK